MQSDKYTPWLRYLSLTTQLLVMIGLAVFAGIKLDEKLQISPILTIILPLLVLATTFYKLIKETGRKNKTNGDNKQEF